MRHICNAQLAYVERRPQRRPHPSMLYRPTGSNHVVALDLTFARDTQGVKYTLLNVLDVATMYNLILRCGSAKPADVINAIKENVSMWAGLPEKLVVDKGSAFGA